MSKESTVHEISKTLAAIRVENDIPSLRGEAAISCLTQAFAVRRFSQII